MSFRNYYDTSSYGRSRDKSRALSTSSVTADRPTTVTAKYLNSTPSYKSSSIPILSPERNDRSVTRDETPISTIANRYSNYGKTEKTVPKYEKKDYSRLSIPTVTGKSRDVSPVSTTSKYSLSRTSRPLSPERKVTKSYREKNRDPSPIGRDKDIPSKTDKSSGYNSLSNYKLYSRTSNYTRPSSRTETKPEITVNRYAIANRLSSNYLRSPPTVTRTSISPVSNNELSTVNNETKKSVSPIEIVETSNKEENTKEIVCNGNDCLENNEMETETVIIITRHTSPTPPGSSAYVRSRRADMEKTIEKSYSRPKKRPEMIDKIIQSERLDDSTRSCRYGNTTRASTTNWSYYSPGANSYTGYAGRYSTQYSNIRENGTSHSYSDRTSRSHSTEPPSRDNNSISPYSDDSNNSKNKVISTTSASEYCQDNVTPCEQNKEEDLSEIVINVNLKLTRAKSPLATAAAELVSPEVTITNSQLPPQVPKLEGIKTKKNKVRKSSTDSSSDTSSKKKVVKKRSKSVSSTESGKTNESNEKSDEQSSATASKSAKKTTSETNLQNGVKKLKHSKSRESNSPESSLTLSTQSSISEDEDILRSKANDVSRTSADENSLPTDKSIKQSSPPPSHKNDSGTEEAKSFLIRALAPVTNLFKMRQHDSSENSRWPENSTSESTGKDISNLITESDRSSKSKDIIASTDDNVVKLKSIRLIESGDRSHWLDSSPKTCSDSRGSESEKNIPRKIRHIESGEKAWWLESNSETKNESHPKSVDSSEYNKQVKVSNYVDDEKPWWLDSSANIPEGIERLSPPRKSLSDSEQSEKFNFFKVRRIESGDQKDWWLTSNEHSSQSNRPESLSNLSKSGSDQKSFPMRRIRHIDSGEIPWWLSSNKNIPEGIEKLPTPPPQEDSDSSDSDEVHVYVPPSHIPPFPLNLPDDEPLGDRRSPEGLETPKDNDEYGGRTSPYENNRQYRRRSLYQKGMERYISRYTDIDDILGTSGQIYSPFMDSILARRTGQLLLDDDECEEIDPTQVRIHDSTAQRPVIRRRGRSEVANYREVDQLDDATLQVFKDGDYGPYLDLESTLGEQDEELEGLQENRKNSLVLRTQLPVRVHAIIEKLLHSQGRELRRALFTLKQILQSDKDLVHDFVVNKGLDCLMQVGNMEDQNYIDYILRALGQILLYVDGMHGVMSHKRCIQWLYSLISSKFRHVVKTALKLLVVFVEYTEKNSLLLIEAVNVVDTSNGRQPWYNVMKILQDIDASDTELLIYATTLINICLNNIPDKDTYYDQVDSLQDQGMDDIIHLYMTKQGTDLDLLRQLQIFEAVLLYEDGDETGTALKQLDESVVSSVRRRSLNLSSSERRKSKKQQIKEKVNSPARELTDPKTKANHILPQYSPVTLEGKKDNELNSIAIRRKRDRFARQAHHIIHQEKLLSNSNNIFNGQYSTNNGIYSPLKGNISPTNTNFSNGLYANTNNNHLLTNGSTNINNFNVNGIKSYEEEDTFNNRTPKNLNLPDVLKNGNQRYTSGLKQRIQNGTLGHSVTAVDALTVIRQKQMDITPEVKDDRGIIINKEHCIKDLAQRLTCPKSPTSEDKPLRVSEMAGLVSKAKEELAKSQSKEVIKSPSIEKSPKVHDLKVSENELHWEELRQGCLNRAFQLCDLDFSDLCQDSDDDMFLPATNTMNGPPPPPPGMFLPTVCPPPPPGNFANGQRNIVPAPPPKPSYTSKVSNGSDSSTIKKNKKTVKLFWREVQDNPCPVAMRSKIGGFVWDDLPEVSLDTKMLEHLFESRTNDLIIKKLMEPKRNLILDTKRSNAINIAMKKLPTPQTIKAAIMKMDATVVGREGIEKLLTMLPTEEEKIKIHGAQCANPDLPLGSAEQFLLTLSSINELSSRLKLWVFKLDFDNSEKEIAEPLMDLKQGIELLKVNNTFKIILATLRTVGSFLNGNQVKGFRLEYLSKVMEVKDTVHKHPLLHHICEMIIKKFPDSSDLFSEVGPVIRASKVDFEILGLNLQKLESDCKASWDHMKRIAKHDGSQIFKTKINDFLTDAAERIILLTVIRKRVISRYNKFLLYLGVPPGDIGKTKPSEFLKVIAEFALEYRTARERVLQQLERRANHRERNKTRGKMIIDIENYSNKLEDNSADSALIQILKTDNYTDSFTKGRRKSARRIPVNVEASADDEIIECLVKSATTSKRKPITREQKKNRISDKKTFTRTLDRA